MSPLTSSCDSTSTSPNSAASSSIFTNQAHILANGSSAISTFSPSSTPRYSPALNFAQGFSQKPAETRPRVRSMYVASLCSVQVFVAPRSCRNERKNFSSNYCDSGIVPRPQPCSIRLVLLPSRVRYRRWAVPLAEKSARIRSLICRIRPIRITAICALSALH